LDLVRINFETLKKFSIDRLVEIVEENVDLSMIEDFSLKIR